MPAPHTHEIRVYFEDTDFTGRVYHGAFVHFLERGRTEFLRAAGVDHQRLARGTPSLFFTLRRLDMSFSGPAFIDDLLAVHSTPGDSGRALFRIEQSIVRNSTVLVRATVELCLIDESGRPARPPAELVSVFANIA